MDLLDLREPVSTWTHAVGVMLAIPGTWLLWRRCGGDRAMRIALATYGASLACCYATSAVYHGLRLSADGVALLAMLDRIGIYGLIAGTYTPVAWGLLRGRWRLGVLAMAWASMIAGSALQLACGTLPNWVSTALYLAMGWGAVFCYAEMGRAVTHRALSPVLIGGVLYSVGAAINLLNWPVPWPGVFGAHELFHVFVMAGSLAHFLFVLRVVIPFSQGADSPRPAATLDRGIAPRPHVSMARRTALREPEGRRSA